MKKFIATAIFFVIFSNFISAQTIDRLKINPLQLVTFKETKNITNTLGGELFPGYDFSKMPALFYRPKVQELLVNYPHRPQGFSVYTGFNPLPGVTIYARNDSTLFKIDDQNTNTKIEDIGVLVVADYFSSMRNRFRDVATNRDKDFVSEWLDEWEFIPSPYDEIRKMLHEGFHVYQATNAPEKFANESNVADYPLLDPVNNSLCVLEGKILRDALLSDLHETRLEKAKELCAIRTYRHSLLKKEIAEYENLNEYVEGLAKYIEYKFLKTGDKVKPIDEMYYVNGFRGYKEVLQKHFKNEMEDMVSVISVSDNRFGNKYGSGPMRFRLYYSGACLALILDEVMPEWKKNIFKDGVYLGDLLKNTLQLSEEQSKTYLEKAKTQYDYNKTLEEKKIFEAEGKEKIQEKLNAILNSQNTLITISYKNYNEIKGMSYTPFGITQINEDAAIYDLVPIVIVIAKDKKLVFKKIIPVYIDDKSKEITFEVKTPVLELESFSGGKLETDDFTLAEFNTEIKAEKNHLYILLK